MITTYHQVKDYSPDTICVLSSDASHLVTSGELCRLHAKEAQHDEAAHDLCAFDFSAAEAEGLLDSTRFFPLEGAYAQDHVIFAMLNGYAFQDHVLEYDETGCHDYRLLHARLRKREIGCTYAGQGWDIGLSKWVQIESEEFSPNGFSGAPVFMTLRHNRKFICAFGGIVVTAGSRSFHAIKPHYIVHLLSMAIEGKPQQA